MHWRVPHDHPRKFAAAVYDCTKFDTRSQLKSRDGERNAPAAAAAGSGTLGRLGKSSWQVRKSDFAQARCDFDRALLREALFEVLPQAVLEFQNLWANEWGVLDLMSVPAGVPFLTQISEYHLTFAIMIFTIITSTLDLTTPYTTHSAMVGLALYMAALLQLTARLLVFGSVLSMQHDRNRTITGTVVTICYFVLSFAGTIGLYCLMDKLNMYHVRPGVPVSRCPSVPHTDLCYCYCYYVVATAASL